MPRGKKTVTVRTVKDVENDIKAAEAKLEELKKELNVLLVNERAERYGDLDELVKTSGLTMNQVKSLITKAGKAKATAKKKSARSKSTAAKKTTAAKSTKTAAAKSTGGRKKAADKPAAKAAETKSEETKIEK